MGLDVCLGALWELSKSGMMTWACLSRIFPSVQMIIHYSGVWPSLSPCFAPQKLASRLADQTSILSPHTLPFSLVLGNLMPMAVQAQTLYMA